MSRAADVHVYLLGGQSNMQGSGRIADLSQDEKAPIENVHFWTGSAIEPLIPGETKTAGRAGAFGPEIGLARELAARDGKPSVVCLIKFHASGKPLDSGWDGADWVGGAPAAGRVNFHPGTHADDPNKGMLYQAMLARFRAGIEALRKRGDVPIIRGFLWMQGEADAKHETSASRYAGTLRLLRDRLAEDLGVKELPMAFGQVLPHSPALPRFVARDAIRRQMAAADMKSGEPEAIPGCRMVPTEGFGLWEDTVHFNSRGQLMLGEAMARALNEASKAVSTDEKN